MHVKHLEECLEHSRCSISFFFNELADSNENSYSMIDTLTQPLLTHMIDMMRTQFTSYNILVHLSITWAIGYSQVVD